MLKNLESESRSLLWDTGGTDMKSNSNFPELMRTGKRRRRREREREYIYSEKI
jgi:hypothetical protein